MGDLCLEIAALGKGIGNTTRYAILEALMKKPCTVGEIVKAVRLSQPTVSQHLKVLKAAKLVTDDRQGQQVFYALDVAYMTGLLKRLALDVAGSRPKAKKR